MSYHSITFALGNSRPRVVSYGVLPGAYEILTKLVPFVTFDNGGYLLEAGLELDAEGWYERKGRKDSWGDSEVRISLHKLKMFIASGALPHLMPSDRSIVQKLLAHLENVADNRNGSDSGVVFVASKLKEFVTFSSETSILIDENTPDWALA